ncbi:MAG: PilZ domain-containing protein [Acidobacteriia bacterium]|nr:PilZ domain-containing protein [Terriglobia bacterium]
MTTERRAAPRYSLILAAEIHVEASNTKAAARSSDISSTGCYLDTLNPLPTGTSLILRLTQSGEHFITHARVVYAIPGMGMGVAFVHVPAPQQAVLERWLAAAAVA